MGALRAFVAVARHLSLSRAGEELHVTHAAVHHQVRNLEEWLGTPLFCREGHRLRLTPSGRQLFDTLSPLFEEIVQTCHHVRDGVARLGLTIGCIPSIASRWLIPRIDQFAQRHPDVDIQMVYARAHERIGGAALDVLITFGADDTPGVIARRVFPRTYRPVCSPHYLQSCGPFDTPAKIAAAKLLHDESREGWRDWRRAAGLPSDLALSGPVYQDFNLLANAVIAGHGIALCPVAVFAEEIRSGFLVVVSDVATDQDKSYYLLTRAVYPRSTSVLVEEFVDWFFREVVRSPEAAA